MKKTILLLSLILTIIGCKKSDDVVAPNGNNTQWYVDDFSGVGLGTSLILDCRQFPIRLDADLDMNGINEQLMISENILFYSEDSVSFLMNEVYQGVPNGNQYTLSLNSNLLMFISNQTPDGIQLERIN